MVWEKKNKAMKKSARRQFVAVRLLRLFFILTFWNQENSERDLFHS